MENIENRVSGAKEEELDEFKQEEEWIEGIATKLHEEYLQNIRIQKEKGAKISMWLKDKIKCVYKSDILWLFNPTKGYWVREPESKNIIKKIVIKAVQDEGSQQLISQAIDTLIAHSVNDHIIFRDCILGNFINLKNGVLNMDTYKLIPHNNENNERIAQYYFTSYIDVDYTTDENVIDFEAPLNFIAKISENNNKEIRYNFALGLLQDIGYILIEGNPEQKAFMYVGEGSNGKSTFLNVIRKTLGKSVISALSLQDINNEKFRLAQIIGKIANMCPDIPQKSIESDSNFKAIVGGDPIIIEQKFKLPFDYNSNAKLFFSANTLPPHESSLAWNRRWIIRNWKYTFSDNEKDKYIEQKLTTPEAKNGWLHLILIFREIYKKEGFIQLPTPEEIGKLYQEKAKNSISIFVNEAVKQTNNEKDSITASELYDKYAQFCDSRGLIQVQKPSSFYHKLPHYIKLKSGRVREKENNYKNDKVTYYYGIKIKENNENQEEQVLSQESLGARAQPSNQGFKLRPNQIHDVKEPILGSRAQLFFILYNKIFNILKLDFSCALASFSRFDVGAQPRAQPRAQPNNLCFERLIQILTIKSALISTIQKVSEAEKKKDDEENSIIEEEMIPSIIPEDKVWEYF